MELRAVPWCGGRWGETKDMIPVSVVTQVVLGDQASCVCCGTTDIQFVSITKNYANGDSEPSEEILEAQKGSSAVPETFVIW